MVLIPKLTIILILILLLFIFFLSPVTAGISADTGLTGEESLLEKKICLGEAAVWYLGHSGWAVTCPMHQGGGERFNRKFAREALDKGAKTEFFTADKRGDSFFYSGGKISE